MNNVEIVLEDGEAFFAFSSGIKIPMEAGWFVYAPFSGDPGFFPKSQYGIVVGSSGVEFLLLKSEEPQRYGYRWMSVRIEEFYESSPGTLTTVSYSSYQEWERSMSERNESELVPKPPKPEWMVSFTMITRNTRAAEEMAKIIERAAADIYERYDIDDAHVSVGFTLSRPEEE